MFSRKWKVNERFAPEKFPSIYIIVFLGWRQNYRIEKDLFINDNGIFRSFFPHITHGKKKKKKR